MLFDLFCYEMFLSVLLFSLWRFSSSSLLNHCGIEEHSNKIVHMRNLHHKCPTRQYFSLVIDEVLIFLLNALLLAHQSELEKHLVYFFYLYDSLHANRFLHLIFELFHYLQPLFLLNPPLNPLLFLLFIKNLPFNNLSRRVAPCHQFIYSSLV